MSLVTGMVHCPCCAGGDCQGVLGTAMNKSKAHPQEKIDEAKRMIIGGATVSETVAATSLPTYLVNWVRRTIPKELIPKRPLRFKADNQAVVAALSEPGLRVSFTVIAAKFGISRARVSQIYKKMTGEGWRPRHREPFLKIAATLKEKGVGVDEIIEAIKAEGFKKAAKTLGVCYKNLALFARFHGFDPERYKMEMREERMKDPKCYRCGAKKGESDLYRLKRARFICKRCHRESVAKSRTSWPPEKVEEDKERHRKYCRERYRTLMEAAGRTVRPKAG
jgi:hypothetical protein